MKRNLTHRLGSAFRLVCLACVLSAGSVGITSCEQVEELNETWGDTNEILQEGVDAKLNIRTETREMKVVDGVRYDRTILGGTVIECIVYDASGQTPYASAWSTLSEQDDLRIVQPTPEQITECATG